MNSKVKGSKGRKSVKPFCPKGRVLRKAYTSRRGKSGKKTLTPARCIIKQGIFPGKSATRAKNVHSVKRVSAKLAANLSRKECNRRVGCVLPSGCPSGKIMRDAYVRKGYKRRDGTSVKMAVVPQSCIKDRGSPGKGPRKIFIDPADHILSEHGYEGVKDMTEAGRRKVLRGVIKAVAEQFGERRGYTYTIRALIARSNIQRNTNPDVSRMMKKDQEYVSGLYLKYKAKKEREMKKSGK